MMRFVLLLAVLAGCKRDAKECAALVERTEQRILADRTRSDMFMALHGHADEIEGKLPRVDTAAWPFEPGVILHVDPTADTTFEDGLDAALAAEACQQQRTKQAGPIRVYLLAQDKTPAARFAARVAWIEAAAKAWNVRFEVLLPVQLPKEVRYWDWPPGTSDAIKELGREILDAKEDEREASIRHLQQKIRLTAARCPEIAKRTIEWGEGGEIRMAMPQGLRDCECTGLGVDAEAVIAVYHIFDISSSDRAWLRVSASEGTPLKDGATVGELVAGAKGDAKATLRVPAAAAREVAPLACDKLGPAILLGGIEQWETDPPSDYEAFLAGHIDQLDACIERTPPSVGVVGSLYIATEGSLLQPGEGETRLSFHGVRETWDLERCMDQRFEVPNQAKGFARLEVYVPGRPRPD